MDNQSKLEYSFLKKVVISSTIKDTWDKEDLEKLYKEFKNLPYEYGATIGHSMITNDLKSIEDAINESVEDMKQKKQDLNRE